MLLAGPPEVLPGLPPAFCYRATLLLLWLLQKRYSLYIYLSLIRIIKLGFVPTDCELLKSFLTF